MSKNLGWKTAFVLCLTALSPLSVSRVMPPTTTIANTSAATSSSHVAIA